MRDRCPRQRLTGTGPMSSGPGFVIADMNLPLKRVNVISLCAEDLAGTRSFYREVPDLPLTFEDEAAAAFRLENLMSA